MKSYEEMLEDALKKLPKEREMKGTERFKIPSVSVEHRGNKTFVKNFREIAEYLRRSEKHLSKFMLKEVGIAGQLISNQLVLNGIVRREILQKKLEKYIKEFVICDVCGNADTLLEKKGRITFLRCEACGNRKIVREL